MNITLCVEENKVECKESGSDIKAVYQIPHFDLRKQRKKVICSEKLKIKFEMDGKLCPRIHPPPSFFFGLNPNPPPFRKGEGGREGGRWEWGLTIGSNIICKI